MICSEKEDDLFCFSSNMCTFAAKSGFVIYMNK